MFVHEYGYTVSEHDPELRWIVREQRHEKVQLDDDVEFFEWSAARYPQDRYTVQLDPWSLTPKG
jgi:hypothetical protein